MSCNSEPDRDLPVTIIGGYLGAGKTTLINALLHQLATDDDSPRLAILVNDFGDIAIDAALIQSVSNDVMQLAGGCVCCTIGSDLIAALTELPGRIDPVDHVLIETSGVAMPGTVAATAALAPGMRRHAVIVLADGVNINRQRRDSYIGDTIDRQLAAGDLIVLTKTDLIDEAAAAAATSAIASDYSGARVIQAVGGKVPADVLLDSGHGHNESRLPAGAFAPGISANEQYRSLHYRAPTPVQTDSLLDVLGDPRNHVIRAKGFYRDTTGEQQLLQLVGTNTTIESMSTPVETNQIIVIGLTCNLDADALNRQLAAIGLIPPESSERR